MACIAKGLAAVGLLVFSYSDQSNQDTRIAGFRGDFETARGNLGAAIGLYNQSLKASHNAGSASLERKYLNNIGACQLGIFRFEEAAPTLLKVRASAKTARDFSVLASATANLSALFAQCDDLAAAEVYARESLEAYTRAGQSPHKILLTLAEIVTRRALTEEQYLDPEREDLYHRGIRAAEDAGDWAAVSQGWRRYGRRLAQAGRFGEAERALTESFRLSSLLGSRRSREPAPVSPIARETCLWELSKLRLAQSRFEDASRLIDSAIAAAAGLKAAGNSRGMVPGWMLQSTRAKIALAAGRTREALDGARVAISQANAFRSSILSIDCDRIGAAFYFDEAYSTLIDAANALYLKTGEPALLRESFEAAEQNRSETLEALRPGSNGGTRDLPLTGYRDKLFSLMQQEKRMFLSPTPAGNRRLAELQVELEEMELGASSPLRPAPRNILGQVARNLPADSVLLSFHLGKQVSWLWAVDQRGLHLRKLPPKAEIETGIRDFEQAIQQNDSPSIASHGQRLYEDLFGGAEQSYAHARTWYLSLDEPLFGLSFPALVVESSRGKPVYLTERKHLQIIPGAALFDAGNSDRFQSGHFLFAGDGIYNHADPRVPRQGLMHPAVWSMPRLSGSAEEIRFAAGLWPNVTLLSGDKLNRQDLLNEIDRDPAIIHIASHVVEGRDRWHSALLALGIDPSGEPELLTPEEILLHPIHSRLVVMTGCSSGSAEVVPVAGLMGLTRAWLTAGASKVIATRWPTRDETTGGLIAKFYVNLLASRSGDVQEALSFARRELIAEGGWRAEPRYWASFFLIGSR